MFMLAFVCSCESESDDDQNFELSDDPGISVIIDGGTFDNYNFGDGLYETSKPNPDVIYIQASDINNNQIYLNLNSTGGFSSGAVKEIGNTDTNNNRTYLSLRQASNQLTYNAISSGNGQIVIQSNRAHPTEAGKRLISGTISVSASTTDASNATTVVGIFTDIVYDE
jgi:hypothetical protein